MSAPEWRVCSYECRLQSGVSVAMSVGLQSGVSVAMSVGLQSGVSVAMSVGSRVACL